MEFKHLVVAIDNSEAGRSAALFAGALASRSGAELTVLNVLPANGSSNNGGFDTVEGLEGMLGREVFARYPSLQVEFAVARGVPQVEIPRYVERVQGDLIILGRKPRSRSARLILGDTADAVVRRSRVPCLLVPVAHTGLRRVLVALDGSDRGLTVMRCGLALVRAAHLDFSAVTVEPRLEGAAGVPSARSERLALLVEEGLHQGASAADNRTSVMAPLQVRQGDPVEEIVAETAAVEADILVIGFHPGGPLLVVEEGSVSRKLLHSVPCAVLTIPL